MVVIELNQSRKTTEQEMTKQQLIAFIKRRNSAEFNSNLQFQIDAEASGFKHADLGEIKKETIDGIDAYRWDTDHGCLIEVGRTMLLYETWGEFQKLHSYGMATNSRLRKA